jgi:hypothetical protein
MEEILAGYLLNALDPDTERQVEQYILDYPQARPQLEKVKRTLELLAADKEIDPPTPQMRYQTFARVAEYRCRTLPQAPAPTPAQRSTGRAWWRRADVIVAACLLVVLAGVGAPLIYRSWSLSQKVACQNNLSRFYIALSSYADQHEGALPKVEAQPPHNVAGMFVAMIPDTDFSVTCPANGNRPPCRLTLAEIDRLQTERPDEFRSLAHNLAGCYAYTLGYHELIDGQECHFGLTRDCGAQTPILADRPPFEGNCSGEFGNSLNHGGKGQNVLFMGGYVRFCTEPVINGDDIYHNRANRVAAGLGRYDVVLGASSSIPYPPDDQ